MTTRKNKVVCPYCGYEKRGLSPWSGDGLKICSLTAREYPSSKVTLICDSCGRKYEVRAEKCVFYKTKKVTE